MTHAEAVAAVRRGDRVTNEFSLFAAELPACPGGRSEPGHHWRTLFCDSDTDVVECGYCGRQRVTACNFDEEYA